MIAIAAKMGLQDDESIKQYGFVQPIVIDRDGVVVIGHCRALVARKLTARKEGVYGKSRATEKV